MIQVRQLTVRYGNFTLRDVNLELRAGGCLAILGPSGAGKTLLLETVMGARRPQSGSVLLDGRRISDLPAESRRLAYIPQDLALFPHLSVRENIVFGLPTRAARRSPGQRLERLAELLRIEHLLDRPDVQTLSGGERQRVALARALIVEPRVLCLDEPFTALDASTCAELLRLLRSMRRQLGLTVFLVTHDVMHASYVADEVGIMIQGRVVEAGPPERVLRRPRSVAVARFLNIRNIHAIASLPPPLAGLADSADGATHVAIHAEDIRVLPGTGAPGDLLRARLDGLIPAGSSVIAELTVGGETRLEAAIPHGDAGALGECVSGEVALRIPPDRVLLLSGSLPRDADES